MTGVLVIATDFSAASARGVKEAAERFPGSRLILVHVVDPAFSARVAAMTGLDGDGLHQKAVNRADNQLDETLGSLREQGHTVDGSVVEGELVASLCEAVKQHGAHTLVLGMEHRDALDRLPWRLAACANVPLLVMPAVASNARLPR